MFPTRSLFKEMNFRELQSTENSLQAIISAIVGGAQTNARIAGAQIIVANWN